MAKRCDVCGRKSQTGNYRSKSMIATKSKRDLNLQTRTENGKKIKICVNCLKSQFHSR